MPRLAANLSMLFTELPFLERFGAAARAGFRAVEYQFPYAFGSAAEVAQAAQDAGVRVVLHNMPAGDASKGDRGLGCLPDRRSEFRDGVARAVEYARAAGCTRLNCLAGVAPRDAVHCDTLVENVRIAASALDAAGMQLMIEPINVRTVPGFFLTGTAQAIGVLDAAGAANAFVQYDLFHMQIMEGDLAKTIERLLPRIGHMQLADVPGRHEPGSGEINYPWLLAEVDRLGYAGWIGCEYNPQADTLSGLEWAKPYLTNA
ncbi:MAG: 2-oxo-tetronate isomerase [Burkholderiales bacterium]